MSIFYSLQTWYMFVSIQGHHLKKAVNSKSIFAKLCTFISSPDPKVQGELLVSKGDALATFLNNHLLL
jgi:hypothetical protein